MKPPFPHNEAERIDILRQYQILDTPPESAFDEITLLVSKICGTPIALIALVDSERVWFKSKVGLTIPETARDFSICAHTTLQPNLLIVSNVLSDARFADNPLVPYDPNVRFYAGVPLKTPTGLALGTVCAIDCIPRQLDSKQNDLLQILGRHTATLLDLRRELAEYSRTKEALDTPEAQYRSLFKHNPQPMWIYDIETLSFLAVNEAAIQHYGYSREEFLSMTIKEISPPEEIPSLLENIAKAPEGLDRAGLWRHRKKDGTIIDVGITSHTLRFSGRRAKLVLANDVTERKRAGEALREIEQGVSAATGEMFFRSLVTHLTRVLGADYAFVGEVLKEKEGVIRTIAVCSDDVIVENFEYLLAGAPCEQVVGKVLRSYPQGVGDIFPKSHLMTGKRIESYIGAPLFDSAQHPLGLLSVMRRNPIGDVKTAESIVQIFAARAATELERKRAEEALAAEKERLAVTLRSIGDGVITTDVEGRILLINKVAEILTGWSQEEARGRPLEEVFHVIEEKTGRPIENPAAKVLQSRITIESVNHTILLSRDGTKRFITDSADPIWDNQSRIIGVVLAFRDVTQKLKMEEDLLRTSKLEAIGLLAGGIAHDFNNILTAILGNLSLIKISMDCKDPLHKRVSDAETASFRARDLAQQLLTFAKGGTPLKRAMSIKKFLEDSIQFALRGSNVHAVTLIADDLWPVEIDEGQINQVINNLVINAQQAMPQGGTIEVRAENYLAVGTENQFPLPPGPYAKISIRDFGTGISREHLPKIFDPYFTTKQRGSGLGLPTSYSIIKKHDGYITVDSEVGEGSTFSIYLPGSSHGIEPERKLEAPLLGRGKVLIMDDDEAVREVAGEILRFLGYQVEYAKDGSEAIACYQEASSSGQPFDLVIMDLTIPGKMGGKEAMQRLLEIDPHVKAIVSSGYSNSPVMANYLKYGFKGVITKPYTIEQVSKTINRLIEL
ncbi:PAS domain S-box protein [Candidatus Manganitrophus noduliformans]|uniref:histidine kinase n=1 Tax=Candidatus Manganitrophus noduliformans TaxID=2606439 RepID=A0A7X6DUS4_9BACT|nr:PAS domain S-box protein [Candidatus Manganitrophus noduliformans]NKE73787.1 PAS domain S-box protein [Candidatus Manganitrophus noduliformans]